MKPAMRGTRAMGGATGLVPQTELRTCQLPGSWERSQGPIAQIVIIVIIKRINKIKPRDINFPKGTLPQSPRSSPPAHQVPLFSDNMAQHRRGSGPLEIWKLKSPGADTSRALFC